MEDIFYFSSSKLTLNDIYNFLIKHNNLRIIRTENGELSMNVYFDNENFFHIDAIDVNDDAFSDESDKSIICSTDVQACFVISHNPYYISKVIETLTIILRHFGGWVGNDSDGFEPRFNLQTISGFSYH